MKKLMLFLLMIVGLLGAEELTLSGSVVSDNQKMITSRFMGFVKEVPVSEGDFVKKGDLLYEIDSKEIDSAKAQVELAIEQAKLASQMYKNQYQNVLINLKRHQRLYKKDMVSKFEVENLELNAKNLRDMLAVSKKQIAQAQAKLKEVLNQYKYLRITAPNDGVIIKKNIKVGEMAMPGMPALILTDLTNVKILTEIAESNLKKVKKGKKVDVEIPSINLKTTGVISSIIPSSNPMTHTFKIKISFDKEGKDVYPGMYAIVKLK